MNKLVVVLSILFVMVFASKSQKSAVQLAQKPPMGWNSFDSYGVYLHEKAAFENLEAMAKKLKPFGYEYFVIDAGFTTIGYLFSEWI